MIEIVLPDKRRLKQLPLHFIQYSQLLRVEYEKDRKTSNKPVVEIFIPDGLPMNESIGRQIVNFLHEIDNISRNHNITTTVNNNNNNNNSNKNSPTYSSQHLYNTIVDTTKLKQVLKTIIKLKHHNNYNNNNNNNNKSNYFNSSSIDPLCKKLDDLSFEEDHFINVNIQPTEQLYPRIVAATDQDRNKSVKHQLFDMIDIKGHGQSIVNFVLCAHYFDIVGDLLIRAIRYQVETNMLSCSSVEEARRYFFATEAPSDFDPATQTSVDKEESFTKSSYADTSHLFESVVDSRLPHNRSHHDKKPADIVLQVNSRKLVKAIKDSTVCHKCQQEFGLLIRKHHCRECGYIFCHNCTNQSIQYSSIPKPRYKGTFDYFSTTLRVCSDCFGNLIKYRQYSDVQQTLELLALRFPVLRRFSSMCQTWRLATISYMSAIREIQYSFPTHQFEDFEKKALWRNRKYFQGHCKWIVKLLVSIDWSTVDDKQLNDIMCIIESPTRAHMNCYYLMCTSACESSIPVKDVFPLLDKSISCSKIRKLAVEILESSMGTDDLIYYLPQLVYYLRYESFESPDLKNFLFNMALESPKMSHFLLWELKNCQESSEFNSKYEVLKCQLMHTLSRIDKKEGNQTQSYIYGMELFNILRNLPSIPGPIFNAKLQEISALVGRTVRVIDAKSGKERLEPIQILYPIDPNYVIKRFIPENTTIKDSATKPVKLTFECYHLVTKELKKVDLIFKKDDVRKDRIILNIISIMTKILQAKIDGIQQFYRDKSCLFSEAMEAIKQNDVVGFCKLQELHNILPLMRSPITQQIIDCNYQTDGMKKIIDDIRRQSSSRMEDTINQLVQEFNVCKDGYLNDMKEVLKSIVTYTVLPVGSEYGFIEVVQDAETLCSINQNYTSKSPSNNTPPISEYLKKGKGIEHIHPSIQNFKRSLAAWMVITHLLGVGDRHNENIMIKGDGHFFHIDYGFILGKEPKPISNFLRYSKDFLKAIEATENIESFKKLSALMFGILRKEASFFLYHLMFLNKLDPVIDNSSRFSQTYIQDEVASRFFPGLPTEIAERHFETLLDSHRDTMSQYITDKSHFLSKVAPQVTHSTLNLLSTSITSFGSYIMNLPTIYRNDQPPQPNFNSSQ